jgi:glycosyltransferase involved in cell wall biosynthesis
MSVEWPGKLVKSATKPFVSILTPTYNRRAFIPYLIACIKDQTYPKERMEWVVFDDGSDSIEDLLKPEFRTMNIQYIRPPLGDKGSETKLSIGAKRNRLHAAARGEILVCMDDDDYYPPERVNHAVMTLVGRKASLAGSTRNHVFFPDDGTIWETGPYGPNHGTFGTMAFTKEYVRTNKCDESRAFAEEVEFTQKYSVPLVQLEPRKVMLVIAHEGNTFDKSKLRSNGNQFIRATELKLNTFVRNKTIRDFYNGLKL